MTKSDLMVVLLIEGTVVVSVSLIGKDKSKITAVVVGSAECCPMPQDGLGHWTPFLAPRYRAG